MTDTPKNWYTSNNDEHETVEIWANDSCAIICTMDHWYGESDETMASELAELICEVVNRHLETP